LNLLRVVRSSFFALKLAQTVFQMALSAAAAAAAAALPDNDGDPLKQNTVFYLPKVSRTLKDTSGRNWPGNPAEAEGNMYTKCWDSSKEIIVRMIDTCPCTQVGHGSSRAESCSTHSSASLQLFACTD
jgi:hypothetical protein